MPRNRPPFRAIQLHQRVIAGRSDLRESSGRQNARATYCAPYRHSGRAVRLQQCQPQLCCQRYTSAISRMALAGVGIHALTRCASTTFTYWHIQCASESVLVARSQARPQPSSSDHPDLGLGGELTELATLIYYALMTTTE